MGDHLGVEHFESIRWHLIIKSRHPEKVDGVLNAVGNALGQPLRVLEAKKYWKDSVHSEAFAESRLDADTPADAVFGLMLQARRLALHWMTFGPSSYDGDRWEFELLCTDGFVVPRLTWANAIACNFNATATPRDVPAAD